MPEQHSRGAARERDRGLRRVGRITWQAGAAGVAAAAAVAVAFGHQAAAQRAPERAPASHSREPGGIVIPAQPPKPSSGGSSVTSGAS
jgi:hypothetical protein